MVEFKATYYWVLVLCLLSESSSLLMRPSRSFLTICLVVAGNVRYPRSHLLQTNAHLYF